MRLPLALKVKVRRREGKSVGDEIWKVLGNRKVEVTGSGLCVVVHSVKK